MKTRILKTAVFVLMACVFMAMTGCWDAHELNRISIVAGLGVDAAETEDEYSVSIQIGKSSQKQNEGDEKSEPFILIEASDKTMIMALEKLRLKNSRKLFFHHNQVLVIGAAQARKGIVPLLDFFLRDREMRLETWIVVAQNTAHELLKVDLVQDRITAIAIADMMERESKNSPHLATNLLDLVSALMDEGSAAAVPLMDKSLESDKAKVSIIGTAIFDEGRMVGKLNMTETNGFVLAKGRAKNLLLEVGMDEGSAVLCFTMIDSKANPKLSNEKASVSLDINAELLVIELKGFDGISMNDLHPQIEMAAQDTISGLIEDTFKKTQQYKADIYGFGTAIHRKYPREWKAIKDNWRDLYQDIKLEVKTKAKVTNTGKIADSLNMQENKK